jgi:uncharacterized glyoxalase superfamily protein PhnB
MERAIPILPTDCVDTAMRFYVDALGFGVVFEAHYPHEGGEGTIIGVERGAIRLHLDCPMPGHGREACAYLEVDDADALHEQWRAKTHIADPPENQPWGGRTFTVMDPSGNSLFVVGPLDQ